MGRLDLSEVQIGFHKFGEKNEPRTTEGRSWHGIKYLDKVRERILGGRRQARTVYHKVRHGIYNIHSPYGKVYIYNQVPVNIGTTWEFLLNTQWRFIFPKN